MVCAAIKVPPLSLNRQTSKPTEERWIPADRTLDKIEGLMGENRMSMNRVWARMSDSAQAER